MQPFRSSNRQLADDLRTQPRRGSRDTAGSRRGVQHEAERPDGLQLCQPPQNEDPLFASTFNQVVKNSFRIANRIDIVPMLPWPPAYENVQTPIDLNPVQLLPLPPKILVNLTVDCRTALTPIFISFSLRRAVPASR